MIYPAKHPEYIVNSRPIHENLLPCRPGKPVIIGLSVAVEQEPSGRYIVSKLTHKTNVIEMPRRTIF